MRSRHAGFPGRSSFALSSATSGLTAVGERDWHCGGRISRAGHRLTDVSVDADARAFVRANPAVAAWLLELLGRGRPMGGARQPTAILVAPRGGWCRPQPWAGTAGSTARNVAAAVSAICFVRL